MKAINIIEDLPKHLTKRYPSRSLTSIDTIDVHHSASWTKDYKGTETIESFARTHIDVRNWPGLGYNYVVAPDGLLYKTGYDNQKRWSVRNHNSRAISLMLIGMFNEEPVPKEQWEIATLWVKHLRQAYGVGINQVRGHNEFSGHATNSCPGFSMKKFREDVNL